MTNTAMKTLPITELYTQQPEVLVNLESTPVLLTWQGDSIGVLVHPDTWHTMAEEVKQYKRLARIERSRREMDAGNYYTKAQVEAMLTEE